MRALITTLLALCFAWTVYGYPVKGVVRSGGDAMQGVIVTDGTNFTLTDNKGAFALDAAEDAEFVYITTPSGYHATIEGGVPQFFRKLTGKKMNKVDFNLVPMGNGSDYALFAVADPQTANERHFERFRTETEPDIMALASEYSAQGISPVGIYLGDIVWDNMALFADYRQHMERLGFPVYAVIGNHDYDLNLIGDRESSADFKRNFGPLYYGFDLGENHFIVLDNIVYDTQKKYIETIDEQQIEWLAKYLELLPAGSNVYIAMHAPISSARETIRLDMGKELVELLSGFNATFVSGHAHLNYNNEIIPGLWEYNVGSAGGSWWLDVMGRDGTPNGYKVFEVSGKDVLNYFKSTGYDRSYQYRIYDRGTFPEKPNAVGLKIWDIDTRWKVEWFEDGVYMGEMQRFQANDPDYCRMLEVKKAETEAKGKEFRLGAYRNPFASDFYVYCVPSPYASEVGIVITDRNGKTCNEKLQLTSLDVQAHRGGMGLMPENTIEAMLNAVKLGVNTLELDLQISSDGKVVVSHDPYMNRKFVTKPGGGEIEKERMREYALYRMTYDSIAGYDTGTRPHPDYPAQKNIATHKPLLSDLIDTVESFTGEEGYTPVRYNIEIKSSAKNEQAGLTPDYREFTELALEVLRSKNLGDRLIIQCFDTRTLNYINANYPGEFNLAYLVSEAQDDFEQNMSLLDFVPQWYSPHYSLVNETSIAKWKSAGMKIVPWTVDEPADMERLMKTGIDAMITNYPDRLLKITRKY